MQNSEQPIRSREILYFLRRPMRELLLVGIWWGYQKKRGKERIKQKSKVSTVDIQIKGSALKVSNSKVFSSDQLIQFEISPPPPLVSTYFKINYL